MVEIKFCGMMRADDARQAISLGARYVGVILADGPRALTDAAAATVLSAVASGAGVARVGVFGAASPDQIAVRADLLGLDVVQLHGDPDARIIADVRRLWNGQLWAVLRMEGSTIPAAASDLFDVADAVVLDARVPGKLGGTGVALPWKELRARIEGFRARRARLVLAGGLRPENVASAVDELQPDVVDVSSGVEARVGVKDHDRMRAFRDAVHAVHTR
jgi:phosphoribosylanthranilate isomerase